MTKERIQTISKSAGQRVDKFLNRWISRKLTVLIIASVGLFDGNLDGDNWTIVATGYVAIQGFTDIVERLYKAKNNG
jgi:hypothetical protein